MVDFEKLKKLRKETGISLSDCREALERSGGDINRAKEILREMGKSFVAKKSEEAVKEGIISSYIHPNKKVGVLLEIRCQTDFVARSEEFRNLAHEICLQIAAMRPLFIKEEDIPEDILEREREIYRKEFENAGKTEEILDKIVENKLKKYKEEVSLLSQPWIKDEKRTIKDLLDEHIRVFGENIQIKRFSRFEI